MSATDAHKKAIADAVGALGNSISIHSANPGTTGANEVAGSGYGRLPTVWGAAVIGSGADAGKAVITGSALNFSLPSGDAKYFGVWNGATFLRGEALTPGLTLTTAGQVTVTPVYKYTHTA